MLTSKALDFKALHNLEPTYLKDYLSWYKAASQIGGLRSFTERPSDTSFLSSGSIPLEWPFWRSEVDVCWYSDDAAEYLSLREIFLLTGCYEGHILVVVGRYKLRATGHHVSYTSCDPQMPLSHAHEWAFSVSVQPVFLLASVGPYLLSLLCHLRWGWVVWSVGNGLERGTRF